MMIGAESPQNLSKVIWIVDESPKLHDFFGNLLAL